MPSIGETIDVLSASRARVVLGAVPGAPRRAAVSRSGGRGPRSRAAASCAAVVAADAFAVSSSDAGSNCCSLSSAPAGQHCSASRAPRPRRPGQPPPLAPARARPARRTRAPWSAPPLAASLSPGRRRCGEDLAGFDPVALRDRQLNHLAHDARPDVSEVEATISPEAVTVERNSRCRESGADVHWLRAGPRRANATAATTAIAAA